MALPSAVSGSWNPFNITSTPMPPNLLLMCKILVVAVLATGHIGIMPDPYLPFIPGLDQLVAPEVFRLTLQTTALIAALALLFNRWVRASALLLGSCFLVAVLCSKAYYGNNKTFTGLMLVMAGLSDFDRPPYLLRWQFALVYFGAALNKLLLPDWQSGLFFDFWGAERIKDPLFVSARAWLPPLVAGKIMCWGTIIAEFAVAFGLFVPRLVPAALWINALFQIGLVQFTGGTFTLFFYGMQAAALAFITWPRSASVALAPCQRDAFATRLMLSPAFWLIATALLAIAETSLWPWLGIVEASTWRRILVWAGLVIVILGCWGRHQGRFGDRIE